MRTSVSTSWILPAAALSLFSMGAAPAEIASAEEPGGSGIEEAPITSADRDHWSFKPLVRPDVPEVPGTRWGRNPIDRFILAKLQKEGLQPQGEADRRTLLRRLSFDLTGLPPTLAEIEVFLADTRPAAYERLVDRLLASSAYGERWAQHWLDLARFAETDGFEHDKVRPTAWKYRDWVIDALNRDLPYDAFLRQQLAGDELYPGDPQARIATAFCLSGPDMPDINSQEQRRNILLNEMTATVGSVFLGLQIGCAQCRDHKYDPMSQADFYRLRAVFAPAVRLKKNASVSVLTEQPGNLEKSYLRIRGQWDRPGAEVQPAVPRIADRWDTSLPADDPQRATSGRRVALAQWLTRRDHPLTSRVIVNRLWQHHFGRGLCRSPSDVGVMGAWPLHEGLLDYLACELVAHGWSLKAMHRLMVTSAVYRQASRLDEEVSGKAGMAAWQAASSRDPDNELLWHFPRQRLEGEAIRDAMLAASRRLDREQHGPGVMPPLPAELLSTLLRGQWKTSPREHDHVRRSVYVFARRNLRYPIFDVFDRPDANASCPRRSRSTTAPQSLYLLNSKFAVESARSMAGFLWKDPRLDQQGRLDLLFERTLGRKPDAEEREQCHAFLDSQAALLAAADRPREQLALPIGGGGELPPARGAAWVDLCLAMFNLSEFIYID